MQIEFDEMPDERVAIIHLEADGEQCAGTIEVRQYMAYGSLLITKTLWSSGDSQEVQVVRLWAEALLAAANIMERWQND